MSFPLIIVGIDVLNGNDVAIKFENLKSKHLQLEYESKIYCLLTGVGMSLFFHKDQNFTLFSFLFFSQTKHYLEGIPNTISFLKEGDFSVLIMDLLGPSLEDLFNFCGRKFTMKTVLMIAVQLVRKSFYYFGN